MGEKVKVELLIPEPVHRAINVICKVFEDNPRNYMARAIEGGVEADLANNFESFFEGFSKRIKGILESEI